VTIVRKRVLKRVAVSLGVVVALVALLYFFGGMWPMTASMKAVYAREVVAGRQPEWKSRVSIPIPGCVCHSKDAAVQMMHSTAHISDCGWCHAR
jgi:hypothetical protein